MHKLKTNFHTHTYRCQHADGDIFDYCQAAIDAGLEILGFSDHTPLPDGRWHSVRMSMDQLDEYVEKIEAAKKEFPQLQIFAGLECEYLPEYEGFYRKTLLGEYGLDYLNCGTHFYPYNGTMYSSHYCIDNPAKLASYTRCLIEGINSGLFTFMTHPDLFACQYLQWDAKAIECSKLILSESQKCKVPLELNGYGVIRGQITGSDQKPRWPYPYDNFWRLAAEYDIEVVINSDAHSPDNITAGMNECMGIVEKYSLKQAEPAKLVRQKN